MTQPPGSPGAGPDPGPAAAAAGIRCMLMRGGTSKGLYFLASDLPERPEQRDPLLLRIMGSGHPLQVDGLGGAHSLTSKAGPDGPGWAPVTWTEAERAKGQAWGLATIASFHTHGAPPAG